MRSFFPLFTGWLCLGSLIAPVAAGTPAEDRFAAIFERNRELTLDDVNLRILDPGQGWHHVGLRFNYLHVFRNPQTAEELEIGAQDVGIVPTTTPAEGTAELRNYLQSAYDGQDASVLSVREEAVAGIPGITGFLKVETDEKVFHETLWGGDRNGFSYTFIHRIFTTSIAEKEAAERSRKLRNILRPVDPARTSAALVREKAADFLSAYTGYGVKVPAGWKKYDRSGDAKTDASYLYGESAAFITTSVKSSDELPEEAIHHALFALAGFTLKEFSVTSTGEISGEAPGKELAAERRKDGGKYLYRIRILHRGNTHYFLLLGAAERESYRLERAAEIFRSVHFNAARSSADPEREAAFENYTGLYYFNNGSYAQAAERFRRSHLKVPNMTVMSNYLSAMTRRNLHGDALKFLSENRPAKPGPELQAWEGFLLSKLGRDEEAVKIYEPLFAGGYRDDEDFGVFIDSLLKTGRGRAAQRHCETKAERDKQPKDYSRLLGVLKENREEAEALKRAEEAISLFPQEENFRYEKINILYRTGKKAEAIAVSEKMLTEGFDNYTTHFNLGVLYYEEDEAAKSELHLRKAKELTDDTKDADRYLALISARRNTIAEKGKARNFRSRKYGYSVRIAGKGFSPWPGVDRDFLGAETGFRRGNRGFLVVVPVHTGKEKLNSQSVWNALQYFLNIPEDESITLSERKYSRGGLQFRDSDRKRKGDSSLTYRTRMVRYRSLSYLIAAWTDSTAKKDIKTALDAVDTVKFQTRALKKMRKAPRFSPADRKRIGVFWNQIGLENYNNRGYRKAAHYFQLAINEDPENAVFLENLWHACMAESRFAAALQSAEKHRKLVQGSDNLRAWHAYLLGRTGRKKDSLREYEKLFRDGYWKEDHFEEFAGLLWDAGRKKEALDASRKNWKDRGSLKAAIILVQLLQADRQSDEALAALQEMENGGWNRDVSELKVTALYGAGKYLEALSATDTHLKNDPENFNIIFHRGMTLYQLTRYREAKTVFEQALRLRPASREAEEYITHLAGIIGQGQNHDIKTEISPVVPPSGILPDAPEADLTAMKNGSGAFYEFQHLMVSEKIGEPRRLTRHYRLHIRDSNLVQKYSTYDFSFNPLHERIFVNRLVVRDATGTTIATGNVEDYYVTDDTDSGQATLRKKLIIPIPALAAGTSLELMVTVASLAPVEEIEFEEQTLASATPSIGYHFVFCGSLARAEFRAIRLTDAGEKDGCRFWKLHKPSPYVSESYQPHYSSFLPTIYIGPRSGDWSAIGLKYLESIRKQLAGDREVSQLAEKLVKKTDNEDARIRKIMEYVQNQIQYRAIEFGSRGQIPNTAAATVKNRYGDCKDHSVLLLQLFRASGIKAELALIHSRAPLMREMPSLDQFDHMIVYLPEVREGIFLDGTTKNQDPLIGSPLNLANQMALVLDDRKPFLKTVKDYPTDSSLIRMRREISVDGKTEKLLIQESLSISGYYSAFMRESLQSTEPEKRQAAVERLMAQVTPNLKLLNFSLESLDDRSRPLVIAVRYEIDGAISRMDGKIFLKNPIPWEKYFMEVETSRDRKTPFQLNYPMNLESSVQIRFAGGMKASVNEKDSSFQNKLISYRFQSKIQPGEVRLEFQYHHGSVSLQPENFADFYDPSRKGNLTFQTAILLEQNAETRK